MTLAEAIRIVEDLGVHNSARLSSETLLALALVLNAAREQACS